MKQATVVIAVLVLSALACSQQVATPVPTTLPPTPVTTLSPSPEPSTTPVTTPQWTAKVSQVVVNVRSEPDGTVVGVVRTGDVVEILSCDGSWCKIEKPKDADWKQATGYIFRGCLSDNPEKRKCETK